jgi:hypothetical protein
MTDEEKKLEISRFFKKREKKISVNHQVSELSVPWYKRPLDKGEFSYKLAKNGRYYARHNEWSSRVWIGPYKDADAVNEAINSYVIESLKGSLDAKCYGNIHSVVIDNSDEFF